MRWNYNDVAEKLLKAPPGELSRVVKQWVDLLFHLKLEDYHVSEDVLYNVIITVNDYPSVSATRKDAVLRELVAQMQPLCARCRDKFVQMLRGLFRNRGIPVRQVVWDKFKCDIGPYELLSDLWVRGKLLDSPQEIYNICSYFEGQCKTELENVLKEFENLRLRIPDPAKNQLETIEKELRIYSLKKHVPGAEVRPKVYAGLRHLISDNSSILILARSGYGKTGVVHYIHEARGCPGKPIILNSADLKWSELKGRAKYPGKLEQANRGVLCLDEVHELSSSVQAKLKALLSHRELTKSYGNVKLGFKLVSMSSEINLVERYRDFFRDVDIWARISNYVFKMPDLSEIRSSLAEDFKQLAAPASIEKSLLEGWVNRDYPEGWRQVEATLQEIVNLMRDEDMALEITPDVLEKLKPQLSPKALKTIGLP